MSDYYYEYPDQHSPDLSQSRVQDGAEIQIHSSETGRDDIDRRMDVGNSAESSDNHGEEITRDEDVLVIENTQDEEVEFTRNCILHPRVLHNILEKLYLRFYKLKGGGGFGNQISPKFQRVPKTEQ